MSELTDKPYGMLSRSRRRANMTINPATKRTREEFIADSVDEENQGKRGKRIAGLNKGSKNLNI